MAVAGQALTAAADGIRSKSLCGWMSALVYLLLLHGVCALVPQAAIAGVQSSRRVGRFARSHDPERTKLLYKLKRGEYKAPPVEALLARIAEDLRPWSDGISQEMVERTYCEGTDKSFRLQIIKSKIYIVGEMEGFRISGFNRITKLFLLDVAKHNQLPDVDIVFSTADRCPEAPDPETSEFGNQTRAPIFAYDRRKEQAHCVLYPDFTFGSAGWPLARIPSWEDFRFSMQMDDDMLVPFADRFPKLFFRGAPTGNRHELALDKNFTSTPSNDFRLTGWTGEAKLKDHISLPEHCNYKYLLNLPGNGWSTRLKYLMYCGSAVIWPDDGWEEFWYHLIEDGTHLLKTPPLDNVTRGSSILTAWRRLQRNQGLAESLGFAGRELVLKTLTAKNVHKYFVKLLQQYAELQTFQPKVHLDAVSLAVSIMSPDATFTKKTRTCATGRATSPMPSTT